MIALDKGGKTPRTSLLAENINYFEGVQFSDAGGGGGGKMVSREKQPRLSQASD